MPTGNLKLLNWNVAGAKYLELKSEEVPANEETREAFRKQLNSVLNALIEVHDPDIITLQEVVCYQPEGDGKSASHVIDYTNHLLADYHYFPHWLIDTEHHSFTGKWNKVRSIGGWLPQAFFAQGNATLIKKTIPYFRPFDLPDVKQEPNAAIRDRMEVVKLESGLYLGDRNTEPRAALVTHLVLSELRHGKHTTSLVRPLDIFVVNLHLTTLMGEREGIPDIDEEAANNRLRQLDIVLNGIVSRYNRWVKDGFKIRGKKVEPRAGETYKRHSPIWILTGDFNCTPESMEYQTLIRKGFIDLVPNHDLGTKTRGLGENPTLTVDYAFAGPRFEAIDPEVAKKGILQNSVDVTERHRVSDHFPLVISVPIDLPEP
jgi:endonuclease/exonuclease/phosphatase family metal-dependent hydrolase